MLNHISTHGVQNVEESLPLIANNPMKEDSEDKFENGIEESDVGEGMDGGYNSSVILGNGDEVRDTSFIFIIHH